VEMNLNHYFFTILGAIFYQTLPYILFLGALTALVAYKRR
jgi:hypothetical protein